MNAIDSGNVSIYQSLSKMHNIQIENLNFICNSYEKKSSVYTNTKKTIQPSKQHSRKIQNDRKTANLLHNIQSVSARFRVSGTFATMWPSYYATSTFYILLITHQPRFVAQLLLHVCTHTHSTRHRRSRNSEKVR